MSLRNVQTACGLRVLHVLHVEYISVPPATVFARWLAGWLHDEMTDRLISQPDDQPTMQPAMYMYDCPCTTVHVHVDVQFSARP